MKNSEATYTITGLIVLAIIALPFFTIRYFELAPVYKIIYKYYLIPICVSGVLSAIYLHFKIIIKYLPPRGRFVSFMRNIFSVCFYSFCCSIVFFGVTFSLIITTNALFSGNDEVYIDQPVIKYSESYGKAKSKRIKFIDPDTKDTVNLGVRRQYKVGEHFQKTMHRGRWGILYSVK